MGQDHQRVDALGDEILHVVDLLLRVVGGGEEELDVLVLGLPLLDGLLGPPVDAAVQPWSAVGIETPILTLVAPCADAWAAGMSSAASMTTRSFFM
jgi:hypothetical protein